MATAHNLQRETLRKLQAKSNNPLIPLRLEYSEKHKLLTGYVNKLVHVNRIFPTHLPTQASYRWSTQNPPITNWPRACINPTCPQQEHEWTDDCWSVRDILAADADEVLVVWDHDNIEGKLHDLIVNDIKNIIAHKEHYDLHTITCCDIFNYTYPTDLRNPHSSDVDAAWRAKYNWQGKDTKQRVLSKNFNHGSKYSKSYTFVHKIKDIEQYGVERKHLVKLAKHFIKQKGPVWQRKLDIMYHIQRSKVARTLYGARRVFPDSSDETGREGFSHMISGTVSDYNNMTLIMLHQLLQGNIRLLHNAHDGDKVAIKKDYINEHYCFHNGEVQTWEQKLTLLKADLAKIIEREVTYQDRSLVMTAGIKIYS